MRRGYFGENGILARLRADFGGAAAGLDGSLREAVRSLAPKRAILAAPKAVIHIIPKKRFPPKVEKKAQQLPGFWRRAHKLSTRLSTDRSAPPGASAQPQNRPKRGEKVYPATLYHTLPAHANKRMVGRTGRVLPRRADNGQRYIFYIFCVREMHIRGRRRMHQLRLAERSNYRTSAAADPGTPPG